MGAGLQQASAVVRQVGRGVRWLWRQSRLPRLWPGARKAVTRWQGRRQNRARFLAVTFLTLGHLAKADGRVSEREIAFASDVMRRMGLAAEHRRHARHLFNEGKRADFPLLKTLVAFRRDCQGSQALLTLFLELQLQMVCVETEDNPRQRQILATMFETLGFSVQELQTMAAQAHAARHFSGEQGGRKGTGGEGSGAGQKGDKAAHAGHGAALHAMLRPAYTLLGVTPEASDEEVKRAYRRQMSLHHPDKLQARGMPEEMIRVAHERSVQIRHAYEQLKAARRMR